jgi:hypothetical protein
MGKVVVWNSLLLPLHFLLGEGGGSARRHCDRGRRGSTRVNNIGPQQQESGLQSLLQVWTRAPNSAKVTKLIRPTSSVQQLQPQFWLGALPHHHLSVPCINSAFLVGRVSRRVDGRFWIAEERAHLNFRIGRRSIEKRSYCFNPSAHGSFEGELFL